MHSRLLPVGLRAAAGTCSPTTRSRSTTPGSPAWWASPFSSTASFCTVSRAVSSACMACMCATQAPSRAALGSADCTQHPFSGVKVGSCHVRCLCGNVMCGQPAHLLGQRHLCKLLTLHALHAVHTEGTVSYTSVVLVGASLKVSTEGLAQLTQTSGPYNSWLDDTSTPCCCPPLWRLWVPVGRTSLSWCRLFCTYA